MAAIIKANSTLTSGGIATLKRSFTTTDDGLMTYAVEYCCLSQYASRWTANFRTGAQPPTALPANMLQLQLTKTPTLYDLQTETLNGLTYFRATYSAGVPTDITITETSDVRNISFPITYPAGTSVRLASYGFAVAGGITGTTNSFVTTGIETITGSFDYVSYSVTATAKNAALPTVRGYVGDAFNFVNVIRVETALATTIETSSKTKNNRGEYTFSKTSTGVYTATPVVRRLVGSVIV
jgi:hypothetical protein